MAGVRSREEGERSRVKVDYKKKEKQKQKHKKQSPRARPRTHPLACGSVRDLALNVHEFIREQLYLKKKINDLRKSNVTKREYNLSTDYLNVMMNV